MHEYTGKCLCGETSYIAKSEPINPHLCSCTMCQKSSGAPTVAWLAFPLKTFQWAQGNHLALWQSSEKTHRCFCQKCGSFIGAINEGCENISITIASLESPNLVVPGKQHSYQESAPSWWEVSIKEKDKQQS